MAHTIDMVMDWQYGSTGKGLIAGYLAKRNQYDTVVCSFAPNAGHTYIDKSRNMHIMTQQIPTGALSSSSIKTVLIGPGASIDENIFKREVMTYAENLKGKKIMIHPHACVVEDYHASEEIEWGMTKIGSTAKGCGAASIERIKRSPVHPNIAKVRFNDPWMKSFICTEDEYRDAVNQSQQLLVEGAQGFSLSMYHGQYPYTTSRDVTPWQIAADCGLPFKMAPYIRVIGCARTFPIRVNNRDGSSGGCYPDQHELDWAFFGGIAPELTTVTKLQRRIFTFSERQIEEAAFHCGGYWESRVFLNFANYCSTTDEVAEIISKIQRPKPLAWNTPKVAWVGYGADDSDVRTLEHTPGVPA